MTHHGTETRDFTVVGQETGVQNGSETRDGTGQKEVERESTTTGRTGTQQEVRVTGDQEDRGEGIQDTGY